MSYFYLMCRINRQDKLCYTAITMERQHIRLLSKYYRYTALFMLINRSLQNYNYIYIKDYSGAQWREQRGSQQ